MRYGVPEKVHSVQSLNLEGELIRELCTIYGIKKTQTTAYHPEGNGQCERFNRTLHDRLSTLPPNKKRRWPEYLPELVYAYSCTPQSSTCYSTYYVFAWSLCYNQIHSINMQPNNVVLSQRARIALLQRNHQPPCYDILQRQAYILGHSCHLSPISPELR